MFKQRVQGFAVGAAAVAALMIGLPMLNVGSPNPELDKFAASLGVDIVWSATHPCLLKNPAYDACFTPLLPNTVFVNPAISEGDQRFFVFHEIAHVFQHRLNMERDECQAYRVADAIDGTYKTVEWQAKNCANQSE